MNRKIIISVNAPWNIYNFRSSLIKSLVDHDYEIIVVAPDDEYVEHVKNLGCRFISMRMDRNGTHPGHDLALILRYFNVLRLEKPLVYLGYTVKPNIYGSIAAHLLRIPVINNIEGLGSAFISRSLLTKIVRLLYKVALRRSRKVVFLNSDDREFFVGAGLARAEVADKVPGCGMDLLRFQAVPPPPLLARPFSFLLVARMLKDKGVEEFVEAARIVKEAFPATQFRLLGFVDSRNPNSISLKRINDWEEAGLVTYLGKADDVRPHLTDADCVVLPSYREGIPRSLLEASAMARPVIATNAVGCRDVVDDNVNGFLCEVKDAQDLAEKMMNMIGLSPENRLEMGRAGRRKVESQFGEAIVIKTYLRMISEIATAGTGNEHGDEIVLETRSK
jgi:glycosyltransferase involved in cell wall biosynthesis